MNVDPTIRTESPCGIQTKTPERRRLIPKHGTPQDNAKRIILVALPLLRGNRHVTDLDDFKELLKRECARLHLAYDSEVVGAAAEVAFARRGQGSL